MNVRHVNLSVYQPSPKKPGHSSLDELELDDEELEDELLDDDEELEDELLDDDDELLDDDDESEQTSCSQTVTMAHWGEIVNQVRQPGFSSLYQTHVPSQSGCRS